MHPLVPVLPRYGGLVLAALGLAAITRSEGRLALAIVLWFVVDRKAKFEESCLVQRYGAECERGGAGSAFFRGLHARIAYRSI
jgi:hypothetical protein